MRYPLCILYPPITVCELSNQSQGMFVSSHVVYDIEDIEDIQIPIRTATPGDIHGLAKPPFTVTTINCD